MVPNGTESYWNITNAWPQTYGNIRFDQACDTTTANVDPCISSGGVYTTLWGTPDITFVPDPPTRLNIVSSAQSIATGACSGSVTVEAEQGGGGAIAVTAATPVAPTTTGTTQFFADADTTCAAALTSVTMAANTSQVKFRFKDATVGTPTLTATAGGLTPTSQVETILGSKLVFTTASQTIQYAACSAIA